MAWPVNSRFVGRSSVRPARPSRSAENSMNAMWWSST